MLLENSREKVVPLVATRRSCWSRPVGSAHSNPPHIGTPHSAAAPATKSSSPRDFGVWRKSSERPVNILPVPQNFEERIVFTSGDSRSNHPERQRDSITAPSSAE